VHPHRGVDAVARTLNAAWRDPDGLPAFLSGVFSLPVSLSSAFGFASAALFVDNLEWADRTVAPHEPFDSAGRFCYAVEHFKAALAPANFVVSSQSVGALYQVLGPIDDGCIDLRPGLDVMTLYEATQDLGSRTRYDFLIQIEGEHVPIRVSVALCGGIPPYLIAWDELHHTMFRIERTPKTDEQVGELVYESITDAQRLVDLLFVLPDERRVVVTGVTREYTHGSHIIAADEG
jgi:hypothetical protein